MINIIHHKHVLDDEWKLILTLPDATTLPNQLPQKNALLDVPVPGTVAEALEKAGKFDKDAPLPLNNQDAWYLKSFSGYPSGIITLSFEGLATYAEIYWDNEHIFSSKSMFLTHSINVELNGNNQLAICFRALASHLNKKRPRARWRNQLVNNQNLRWIRTTMLGYMPGWCPEIHPVGPWRPIKLYRNESQHPSNIQIFSELNSEGTGILTVKFNYSGLKKDWFIQCADVKVIPHSIGKFCWSAKLTIQNVSTWCPHTHGLPILYDVVLCIDGTSHHLGRTGFRNLKIDYGIDGLGFAVTINGEKIFCRGAVWSSADIVRLPCYKKDYMPWLKLAVKAGMNMIRISGITVYESPEFFMLCDELGILVWQDFMFSNFDYPVHDAEFITNITAEAQQFLQRTLSSPSLAILCGGNEIYQQASMLGLNEAIWKGKLTEDILPSIAKELRPDVPYVANSPCNGTLPFSSNVGVSHYYGVSAYGQPLEDARRANVRFATECLAFANISEPLTLENYLNATACCNNWRKTRVPKDYGVSWDFEDVRNIYLNMLYGFEPARLRRENNASYLHLSRAVTAEVMEATFSEWRSSNSSCSGGIVFMLQDLMPGAGWGIIDSMTRPKSSWFALKRAFRPINLIFTDEGINGLSLHIINEYHEHLQAIVELSCLHDGKCPVISGRHEVSIKKGQSLRLEATDIFMSFFDTTYAYRFGPPSHDVVIGVLRRKKPNEILAESFYFPQGRAKAFHNTSLKVELAREKSHWYLNITAPVLAQSVHININDYHPDDNWFHLAPERTKRILLEPSGKASSLKPTGEIRIAGCSKITYF